MNLSLLPQLRTVVLLLVCLACPRFCHAHRLSDACLRIEESRGAWTGCFDVSLRDLDVLVPLDDNRDGDVTWGELRRAFPVIESKLRTHLRFQSGSEPLTLADLDLAVASIAGEPAASVTFQLTAAHPTPASIQTVSVHYDLLFDLDPAHRGLLRFASGTTVQTHVFAPDASELELRSSSDVTSLAGAPSPEGQPQQPPVPSTRAMLQHVREGIHHIWIGLDHILFLLALLIPAVIRRAPATGASQPDGFRAVLMRVVAIVTAFTLAHSITLVLATLNLVQLPSRLVETVIAASVAVVALNNLFPLLRDHRAGMAFAFGLIHGFGFASVLQDLQLPAQALVSSLVGFNLGVELGQLAIVAVFLPVAYALRTTRTYRHVVLQFGSCAILALAMAWLAERALDLDLTRT
ncbi:MAG: HupE/UreJ family protein [Verrucomicrobiales bacterium]|nr:HupE/UreJ family protein [Verrucomicrobiales bacterium]